MAFDELKARLTATPILALPRDEGQYILDVDASGEGLGAVLSQVQADEEKVIGYASRLCNRAEANYCITRRELLALVYGLKQYRQYLLGRSFLIRTDHSALQWLRSKKEPVGQHARWIDLVEQYDFTISTLCSV